MKRFCDVCRKLFAKNANWSERSTTCSARCLAALEEQARENILRLEDRDYHCEWYRDNATTRRKQERERQRLKRQDAAYRNAERIETRERMRRLRAERR
jgi:hypothetical protein